MKALILVGAVMIFELSGLLVISVWHYYLTGVLSIMIIVAMCSFLALLRKRRLFYR